MSNETSGKEKNHIYTTCHKCHKTILKKYWDEELDWYIQLNAHLTCKECSGVSPEDSSANTTKKNSESITTC